MLATMLTLLPIFTSSMVINRITTTDDRELTYVSLAGGADIYISGVGLGTPFRPPTIFVGPTTCDVQSFTSSNTRIHCVLNGDLLPAPPGRSVRHLDHQSVVRVGRRDVEAGDFRMLKLYAVPYGVTARQLREGGRHADCWHVGGTNHDCFVRVDASGTPRLEKVLTPALQPGGLLRVAGQGVDGGLRGEAKVKARLVQAGGGQAIGCNSRYADDPTNALAHSDATSFSCRLDASAASLSGFFDLKLKVLANDRGDAYAAQATSKQLDVAGGATFDAEVLPRIASVAPRSGSAAGGTDLTVAGSGFGSNKTAIRASSAAPTAPLAELSEQPHVPDRAAEAPTRRRRRRGCAGARRARRALAPRRGRRRRRRRRRVRHTGVGAVADAAVDDRRLVRVAVRLRRHLHRPRRRRRRHAPLERRRGRGGDRGAGGRERRRPHLGRVACVAARRGGVARRRRLSQGVAGGGRPLLSDARVRRRRRRHAVGARVHTPLAPPSLMPAARRGCARRTRARATRSPARPRVARRSTRSPQSRASPRTAPLWAARRARARQRRRSPPGRDTRQRAPRGDARAPRRRRGLPGRVRSQALLRLVRWTVRAYYKGQPCVASVERYKDGYVCQTARHVGLYEPAYAMASCAEYGDPYLGSGAVRHDVQRLTLSQDSAQWLEQRIVFEAIECPGTYSCLGGTVRITHGGAKSAPINIRNPSDADVKNAFAPLADGWYAEAGLAAAVDCDSGVSCNNTHVTWVVKLRVAWDACGTPARRAAPWVPVPREGHDHPRRHIRRSRLVLGRRRLPE